MVSTLTLGLAARASWPSSFVDFPSPDGEVEDSSLCFFPIVSVAVFCPPGLCCFTGLACDDISISIETRSFELLLNLQFLPVVIHVLRNPRTWDCSVNLWRHSCWYSKYN